MKINLARLAECGFTVNVNKREITINNNRAAEGRAFEDMAQLIATYEFISYKNSYELAEEVMESIAERALWNIINED